MQITLTYQNPYQAHVYTHIQEIYDFKSVSNETVSIPQIL